MKVWKNDRGLVDIDKEEWDVMFRHFHTPLNSMDMRTLPEDVKAQLTMKICPKCGDVGVTDYDFKKEEWCTSCRECRTRLD